MLTRRVLDDQCVIKRGHVPERDVKLAHHELDAEWHAIEKVGDRNRHLAPSFDQIETRNMIAVMFEED